MTPPRARVSSCLSILALARTSWPPGALRANFAWHPRRPSWSLIALRSNVCAWYPDRSLRARRPNRPFFALGAQLDVDDGALANLLFESANLLFKARYHVVDLLLQICDLFRRFARAQRQRLALAQVVGQVSLGWRTIPPPSAPAGGTDTSMGAASCGRSTTHSSIVNAIACRATRQVSESVGASLSSAAPGQAAHDAPKKRRARARGVGTGMGAITHRGCRGADRGARRPQAPGCGLAAEQRWHPLGDQRKATGRVGTRNNKTSSNASAPEPPEPGRRTRVPGGQGRRA